jgi:hypothetical protein
MSGFLFDDYFDPISRVWRNDAVYPPLDFSEKRRGREHATPGASREKKKQFVVRKGKRGGAV